MKKKINAKERREKNNMLTKRSWEDISTKRKPVNESDGKVIDEFDYVDDMIKRFEEGELEKLPDATIVYSPSKIDKQEFMEIMLETDQDGIEAMASNNSVINSHFILNEEDFYELLTFSAEHGNLFSMLQLAQNYKNDEYPRESEPEYLYWLNKIVTNDVVARIIKATENDQYMNSPTIRENDLLSLIVGSVCYELGLYYRNSDTLEELRQASTFMATAEACGYPSFPGTYVTHGLLTEINERIKELEEFEANKADRITPSDLLRDMNFYELGVDAQILGIKERLIRHLGVEIWNEFRDETRKCLVTSVSCYYYLTHAKENERDLDFSCVIIPLTKTLEHEMRIRFYNGYIDYIKEKYHNPESFFIENTINIHQEHYDRGGVIYKTKRGKLIFSDYMRYQHKYTLGSFIYSSGMLDLNRGNGGKEADITIINYCQERLFKKKKNSNADVDAWLYNFATHIHKIKDERNESAHGGNVKDLFSAQQALNYMILVQKVLVCLIRDCN